LRHRRRARAEDRIRTAKTTGLSNLPLHGFAHNRIWVAIIGLALEVTAWMQLLGLTGHPAGGSPNACGYACSASPGGSLVTPGACLRLPAHAPYAGWSSPRTSG
jgi:hypothetical protein